MNNSVKYFTLFLLALLIHLVIDRLWDPGYIVGLAPILFVGQYWNFKNGIKLYELVGLTIKYNLSKFKALNAVGLMYIVVYMIFFNVFILHDEKPETSIFMPITGLLSIAVIYIPIYCINFVTNLLVDSGLASNAKWRIRMAILFYPIGVWWIENEIKKQDANMG